LNWIYLKGRYYNLNNVEYLEFKKGHLILYFIGGDSTLIHLTELEYKNLENEFRKSSRKVSGEAITNENGERKII
jgi:hypothetical protein